MREIFHPMKLSEILNEGSILLPVKSTKQSDAIQELINHLQKMGYISATSKLCTDIENYEQKQSTATGRGVAYPHCISTEVDELVCVLGISKKGVDYNAPDGQLCHFIVLTLSPISEPNRHRKFISKFRSMIEHGDIRTQFLDSPNVVDIFSIINNWEIEDASSEDFE
jgi:mannitol/fructose-specific phosphotransferase system IIA component (Ntr-type)|tara:strand:+ start:3006 stop:3509 length:504 start_codon:yes stop_codon:yes gene_type:complete